MFTVRRSDNNERNRKFLPACFASRVQHRLARASRGVWGHPLQEILQIQVPSSAIFCILTSFLRWDAFSFNISFLKSNFASKKILQCSEMSACIKRVFKKQILKLHAGWMSGQEIERMMNYIWHVIQLCVSETITEHVPCLSRYRISVSFNSGGNSITFTNFG